MPSSPEHMLVDYAEMIDVPTTPCAIDNLPGLAHTDPIGPDNIMLAKNKDLPSVDVQRTPGGIINEPDKCEETLENESINVPGKNITNAPLNTSRKNEKM